MKKDFNDGVCDNCGNTGLAGEKCMDCGSILSKIASDETSRSDFDLDIDESKEPETYPLDVVDEEIEEKNGTMTDENY